MTYFVGRIRIIVVSCKIKKVGDNSNLDLSKTDRHRILPLNLQPFFKSVKKLNSRFYYKNLFHEIRNVSIYSLPAKHYNHYLFLIPL